MNTSIINRLFTLTTIVIVLLLAPTLKIKNKEIKMGLFDPIIHGIGSVIDTAGKIAGLPEMGISEKFGVGTNVATGLPQITSYPTSSTTTTNTVASSPTQSGSANDTMGGATSYQDPYASLRAGFNTQKSNIYGSANTAAQDLQPQYEQSILETIHNLNQGQQAIDRKAQQNESSRIQGTQGILGMISRGIKSGGVYLGNRNAGSSSAAQAIAQAYGDQGRRQMSTIGNQYAQNAQNIGLDQANQDWAVQQAPNKFHLDLMNNVNAIVSAAGEKLNSLDAAMANASLPDRLAIEQEKQAIKDQVLSHLQQYDAQIAQQASGIKAASFDQNRAAAQNLLSQGQADPNLFNYSTEAPMQAQGGPAASGLPIYINPLTKKQQVA